MLIIPRSIPFLRPGVVRRPGGLLRYLSEICRNNYRFKYLIHIKSADRVPQGGWSAACRVTEKGARHLYVPGSAGALSLPACRPNEDHADPGHWAGHGIRADCGP